MARRALKTTARELVRANRELETAARTSEDKVFAAFVRAEGKVFSRVATLLSGAPNFQSTVLQEKLRWYFSNVPSLEIARENAGYFTAIRSYLDHYPKIGKLAEEVIGKGGVPSDLTNIPRELIDAIRGRDLKQFTDLNAAALRRLDDTLLASVLGGSTPSNTLAAMKGVITGSYPWGERQGLYRWHAGTYVRTGQMRFARTMMKAKADELGLEWFVYIGPADEVTRDFCLDLLGEVMKREDIEELDNGQTGNVFTDGGGYNCRHDWSPVSEELAKELNEAKETEGDEEGEDVVRDAIQESAPAPEAPPEVPASSLPPDAPAGWSPATTIAQAETYAREQAFAPIVDYKTLAVEHVNEFNKQLAAHFEAFPQMKGSLDFVGDSAAYLNWMRDVRIAQWEGQGYNRETATRIARQSVARLRKKIDPTFAFHSMDPTTGKRALVMHSNIFGRSAKARAALEQNLAVLRGARKGYLGVPTVKGLVDHEIGHLIDNVIAGGTLAWTEEKPFVEAVRRLARESDVTIGELISGRAQWNMQEAFAETWSRFVNDADAPAAVKELGQMILKKLQEKGILKS